MPICAALPSTNDCIPAVKAEASQCGFPLALDFATYCAPSGAGSRTNDTCCRMPIVPTGTSSNPTTNNRPPNTTSLAIIIISSIAGATLLLVTFLCCALRRRRKINFEKQMEKDVQNQEQFSDVQPITVDPRFNFNFEEESEPPSPVHESGPAVISRPPPVAYIQESLARGTIPVKPQQRRESLASWSAFSFSVDGSSNAKPLQNLNNYANDTMNSNSSRPVIINTMNGTLRIPPPPIRSPSPSSIAVITAAAAALASEPSQKLKRKTFLFQKGNDSIMSPGLVPPPLPPPAAAPPRTMPKNFLSLYSSNSGSSRTDENRTDSSSINIQSREWNLDSVDTPGPGDIAIVLHEYETTLRDELALVPGDFVQVHAVYLDGWGHGNVGDQFGAFPLVCVKRLVLEGVDVESDNDQKDKQMQRNGASEEEDNRRRRQKKISMANVGGGGVLSEKEVNLRRSSLKLFL
ncbi:hypothetical protein HDU81_004294 [Chytriomyces hyalinus]|nr:hypothetical protein HDU81_004294 [Chytriomyces hyalinus]